MILLETELFSHLLLKAELLNQIFLIPDQELVKKFNEIIKNIDSKISALDSKIALLVQARD